MRWDECRFLGKPAIVSTCYETDCLLCGDKVVVEVTVAPGGGFIKEQVVCDQCKDLWKKIREKDNEQSEDVTDINVGNKAVRRVPAADVVEVVRCCDCKWWHTGGCAFRKDAMGGLPAADNFCSHGERKE